MTRKLQFLLILSLSTVAACTVSMKDDQAATADSAGATAAAAMPGALPPAPMTIDTSALLDSTITPAMASTKRVEVDIKARKLYVFDGPDTTGTYSIAVGSQRWPTQPGEWKITQVVWNPEWTPPDESWAEQREPRKPGDPKNPLGRVQLVYDPPRTIHGTPERASIGKAISHGSIRMYNEEASKVARELMDATGAGKDSAFFRNVERNKTEKVIVDLPGGIPIRVF